MAEKGNRFTAEQLEILFKGFQEHDFTQNVSLSEGSELSGEKAQTYRWLEKLVKGYMKNALPALGVNRRMSNFSKDHPVNLLMNTDASYIAAEAAEIFGDKKLTGNTINQFFDMFGPLVEIATASYCKAKGKLPNKLTAEDKQCIMDRVTQVVNEELISAVMRGQQLPELFDITHDAQAHEDFPNKHNPDAINFHEQWTHCKTQVGEMLSLDIPDAPDVGVDDDLLMQTIRNMFCERLDEVDAEIFRMREDGYTQEEIAEKLGYKNHSAVTKRLRAMRKQWDEFTTEYETKKDDHHIG